MCLYLSFGGTKAKTARKDIICYKILRKGTKYFTSPLQYFRYEKGELYYEDSMDDGSYGRIERGLHSFIHVEKHWSLETGEVLVRCIIPKGSKYYQGLEEYASGHLKIGTDKDIVKTYKK